MWKLLAILALISVCGARAESSPLLEKPTNGRQKRLLFFDEQGNLVKTYANPLLYGNSIEEKNPLLLNFLNPFFSVLQPNIFGSTIAYAIPVSEAVLHQIHISPSYHNKLIILSTQHPVVESSPLCAGRRTQIPSPKMCSNFLNCWDGWAFEQECPAGLLFSKEGYCDYAYNVDCSSRLMKEPQTLCKKDFEAFRNNANCNEFFVCVHRFPVRFQCPADLAYNEELGVCDYPSKVNCTSIHVSAEPAATPPIELSTVPTSNDLNIPSSTASSESTPDKNLMISHTEFNSHSWKSLQVAMSRQEAIKQLQLGQIAHINTGYSQQ
ncbi:uncharacterized protein LOC119830461 [Zerene cesonia]|uniref:uncharacterized protein LOC119830461 n=1 Tax=Zerene cesonia TaxID=33412 RepID=UPI0018E578A0|nr:uncharacterized protein LOC119830461 [Zerene cesonia]